MALTQPTYTLPNFTISMANQLAVQQIVPLFLCPSDMGQPVISQGDYGMQTMGPTNYAVCLGSGTTNGGPSLGPLWNTDGMFQAQTGFRITDITDGTSNTAMLSESTLGTGDENANDAAARPADLLQIRGDRHPARRCRAVPARPTTTTPTVAASRGPPARSAVPRTIIT